MSENENKAVWTPGIDENPAFDECPPLLTFKDGRAS